METTLKRKRIINRYFIKNYSIKKKNLKTFKSNII